MKPKLPKLTAKQIAAIYDNPSEKEILMDTVEVVTTITHILLGAMIEPDRDSERWTRARIRETLAAGSLKRYRTYEILRNAQLKESAFEWLRFYFNKFQLTKAPEGGHLHSGKIVDVDYGMTVEANI